MSHSRNPYEKRTEISMRDELISMFDGTFPEIAKAQMFLLRKMRRDASGDLINCECVDPNTHEPDLDHYCPFCQGDGHYWDESVIELYKVIIRSDVGNSMIQTNIKPGIMDEQVAQFYSKYDADLTKDDKFVELKRDLEGEFVKPYQRLKVWRITSLVDLRSDNGRLEFYKIGCFSEKRRFLNGPNS